MAGADVAGGLVPVFRGAVMTPGGAVVPEVPDGPGATVVFVSMDVDVDEVDEAFDVVVGRSVVVGTSDDVGVWLATCCLDDESSPTATSNRRAARAMVARA